MKRILSLVSNHYLALFMTAVFANFLQQASAQICSDPVNVIYGLSNTGNLHPITVSTGNVGAQFNPPYVGNAPSNPNGLGYNNLDGKFYFFKRSPAATPQEFVSFDPSLNLLTILTSCPSVNIVYVGCVTKDGTGYYCWDSKCNFYYYNILLDSWTFITNVMIDKSGNDVDSIIRANGSGDVAADGNGNLLMLPSSSASFWVYRMNAPLPTSAVASITVTQILPMTVPPGKFVGIALNSSGQIIMSTAAPNNRLYRLENNLSLTFISNLAMDMADLTSCNFPVNILPLSFGNFSASLKNSSVWLSWDNIELAAGYSIEHSINSTDWEQIAYIKEVGNNPSKALSFTHNTPAKGKNYYRIRLVGENREEKYSPIKTIDIAGNASYAVWPNPVQNNLWIQNNDQANINSRAFIFDQSGRKVKDAKLLQGVNTVDMKGLIAGIYIVTLQMSNGEKVTQKILKK